MLLLEDNLPLRRILERATTGAGHTVTAALGHVSEAAYVIVSRPVDVLVADVGLSEALMPLLRYLRHRYPQVRVLLISGSDRATLIERRRIPAHHVFLAKPFTPDAYIAALTALLEGP